MSGESPLAASIRGDLDQAIGSGDVQVLIGRSAETVEFRFLNRTPIRGEAAVRDALEAFYRAHPPVGFEELTEGEVDDTNQYLIGKLRSADSTEWRVHITQVGDEIIEIEIGDFMEGE